MTMTTRKLLSLAVLGVTVALPSLASASYEVSRAEPQCDGDKHDEQTKTEKKSDKKDEKSDKKAPTT